MTGGHKNTPRQHLDLHLLRRCRLGLGVIRRRPIWSLLLLGVLVISGLCWRFRQLWFAGVPGNLADPILRLLLPAWHWFLSWRFWVPLEAAGAFRRISGGSASPTTPGRSLCR